MKSRLSYTEEWISDLEDRIMEITHLEQHKEKQILISENNLGDL